MERIEGENVFKKIMEEEMGRKGECSKKGNGWEKKREKEKKKD